MITLSAQQCRVIGVMLEKETTTPEQYPLSVNAITAGCNQKSNREPVMSLSENDWQNTVDELVQMNQLMVDQKASSRVNKYFHRFCNTEFGNLQFTAQQRAIICVLFLRGPQLQNLNNQTLVQKLEREPGKRESRYLHLFSDLDENHSAAPNTSALSGDAEHESGSTNISTPSESEHLLTQRVNALEQQVATLTEQIACLTELLEDK